MITALALAVMYLVPLGFLVWLFNKNPGYAFIAVVVIAAVLGIGGFSILN